MFLTSPRQSQLDIDIDSPVFAAEEGRMFELECTSKQSSISLRLERNGVLIVSGKYNTQTTATITILNLFL